MVRAFLAALMGLALSLGTAAADDKKTPDKKDTDKKHEATISKIDAKNHTVTVKMKDKGGKDTEKTFKLAETVRYLDSTGKAIAIDLFKSGDEVLVLEADEQIKELHKKTDKK